MARPRKTTVQPENVEEQMLSANELVEVLKFAAQIYNTDPYGYFTPNMSNQNIIDLNNNPQVPTKEKIVKALTDYKNNSEQLQAYSEFMEAFERQQGVAFLLIYYTAKERFYYLRFEKLREFYERMKAGGEKASGWRKRRSSFSCRQVPCRCRT